MAGEFKSLTRLDFLRLMRIYSERDNGVNTPASTSRARVSGGLRSTYALVLQMTWTKACLSTVPWHRVLTDTAPQETGVRKHLGIVKSFIFVRWEQVTQVQEVLEASGAQLYVI